MTVQYPKNGCLTSISVALLHRPREPAGARRSHFFRVSGAFFINGAIAQPCQGLSGSGDLRINSPWSACTRLQYADLGFHVGFVLCSCGTVPCFGFRLECRDALLQRL